MPPATPAWLCCRLEITSPLPRNLGRIPFSPLFDFEALIRQAGEQGVLDPNSIEIIDLENGARVEWARGEEFAHADAGRLEWAIEDPAHVAYEIRFCAVDRRPPLLPQPCAPMVGAGDLLRWNAGEVRPVALMGSMKLVDLRGEGLADLVGCWNYYRRPGEPVSGLVCYARLGEALEFGEMARLRFREGGELHHFPGVYAAADFADVDGDGRVDIAFAERTGGKVAFFLNTGERDRGGWPLFARDLEVEVPFAQIEALQLVDLDGDGALDLVINGHLLRNANAEGWPFRAEAPANLGMGKKVAFQDMTGNGRLDAVYVEESGDPSHFAQELKWRPRTGRFSFGEARTLAGVQEHLGINRVAAVGGEARGLLVQGDVFQCIALYEWEGYEGGQPRFARRSELGSAGAALCLSDQAWPCICDWDGDGVWDLLVGGGYGWPRVLRNQGTDQKPVFKQAELIHAAGRPIRLLRDQILKSRHWHNMGYPYPVFVDWDGDGLPDLLVPNETNRIVWYRNEGTRQQPRFGEPRFLEVEGFADSEEMRRASGEEAEERERPNHPYPRDARSPFYWRTGAAFADWNGDGLMDFITHNHERQATLFVQCADGDGQRLRMEGPVLLEDGRPIDDRIVGREKRWTESFRAVDWDGDGLVDLVYSLAGTGEVYLLRNVGTAAAPVFAAPKPMQYYGEKLSFTIHGPNVWAGDLNGDGKPDLLGCVEWSVYPFFAHAALEMEEHPRYRIGALRRRVG